MVGRGRPPWSMFRRTFRATPSPVPALTARSPRWFYAFLFNKVGLGSTISLPPLFVTEVLGGNVADVGVASSLTSAATVPAAAVWGWLSDRYGTRKSYLILGFLGFGIPTVLMGFSENVLQYMVLSVLLGALSVAGTPVSSTLIMDTTVREEWDETFGRFNQISGWGVVAGRLIGLLFVGYGIHAWGNDFTQRGLWWISGGLSILGVVLAWKMVPEPRMAKPRPPRRPVPAFTLHSGFSLVERVRFLPHSLYHRPRLNPLAGLAHLYNGTHNGLAHLPERIWRGFQAGLALVHNPLVAYYLASFFLFTISTMAYTPFAVWQRQELMNSSSDVFLVGMVNSVSAAFSYRWVGILIKRHGSLRVQMATISVRIVTFGGLALISVLGVRAQASLAILVVLQALSGLGWAGIAVAGNSTVAHLAPAGHEGTAVGTYTSFIGIGSIAGAFISGYVVLWLGYAAVFALGSAGVAVTVLVLGLIRRSASADAAFHL
jgi:MFS family permease